MKKDTNYRKMCFGQENDLSMAMGRLNIGISFFSNVTFQEE